MKDNRPNAIPSFQIRIIFKNFDENISDPENLLSIKITYVLESLSNKKIKKTKNKLVKKFFSKGIVFKYN